MSGAPDNKPQGPIDFDNFKISMLPDGTILRFPKDTPREVQEAAFQKRLADWQAAGGQRAPAQRQVGTGEAFGMGTAQGLTFEFGDEMAAAIGATIGRPGGEPLPGKTWQERYDNGLNIARGVKAAAKDQHPYAYTGGQITGAVIPTLLAPQATGARYIATAPTMGNMMLRSSLVGTGQGAAYGFGAGENSATDRAISAAKGAGAGMIVGAAAPPIVQGLFNAARAGGGAVANWFRPGATITEAAPAAAGSLPAPAAAAAAPRASVNASASQIDQATRKIAQAMERDGYTPDQIRGVLDAMGPQGTLADAGANLRTLLTSAMGAPGPAKQIGQRALDNRQIGEQQTLLDAVSRLLGPGAGVHQTDDALLQQIEEIASPLYRQAFTEGAQVNTAPVLGSIDDAMAKMPTRSPIRAALERVRGLLGDTVEQPAQMGHNGGPAFKPYDDLEMLHNAKLAIDDLISGTGENSLGKVARRELLNVQKALLSAMDEASPAYGQARGVFSGTMTSREALAAGRQFIKEDAEAIAADLAGMSAGDQQLFREGAKRALADIIKSKPANVSVVQQLRKTGLLEKVQTLVPDQAEFNAFVQSLENAGTFAKTRAYATGGSQTTEKTLGAIDLASNPAVQIGGQIATGNKVGVLRSAMDWLGNLVGPGEESRAAIAQRLLETDPAQREAVLRQLLTAQALMRGGNQATAAATQGAVGPAAAYAAALEANAGPR